MNVFAVITDPLEVDGILPHLIKIGSTPRGPTHRASVSSVVYRTGDPAARRIRVARPRLHCASSAPQEARRPGRDTLLLYQRAPAG